MIILRKKRIIAIAYLACLLLIILLVIASKNNRETVQTMAFPISLKTVILDAGHGLPDKRCCSDKII